jgi:Arc/MetJ-type ribon-helix-helix transcriptional regulator
MNVTVPDSLKNFINEQVNSGRYANPDAFVAELLEAEAAMFERVKRGEALPLDEHFDRRLEALLDDAENSGDYVTATKEDFDEMEREALKLIREKHKSS